LADEPPRAVFYRPSLGKPDFGRAARGIFGCAGANYRYANLHGLPTRLASGERKIQTLSWSLAMSQNLNLSASENCEIDGLNSPVDLPAAFGGESTNAYYVYLLRHASEPRFKIGKANDIYQRLSGIGGINEFDLERSLCVKCPTEVRVGKLERHLHHIFDEWRIKDVENIDYSGYTEYFKIECFERVVKYIRENADLLGELSSLPPRQQIIGNTTISSEERALRKLERQEQERAQRIKYFETSTLNLLESFKTLDFYVKEGVLQCGILEDSSVLPPQLQKIRVGERDVISKLCEEGRGSRTLFFASISPSKLGDECVEFLIKNFWHFF
jgi:hypothetical protein